MKQLAPGIFFVMLWASASVATKFGIRESPPLVMTAIRFFLAGGLMLLYAHGLHGKENRLPRGREWRQLAVFSLLNTALYLGAFVLALKEVSAGIGSLATATNPLFIMVLSALWLKRPLLRSEIAGVVLGLAGVFVATYPLLQNSQASLRGLLILLGSMISVSVATAYYASVSWKLPAVVINGWQVLIAGFFMLPFALPDLHQVHWNRPFILSTVWLAVPVSIIALQLWFYMVRKDPVKASVWLFLSPIFGFTYASLFLNESITLFTFLGTALVLAGLYLAQKSKLKSIPESKPSVATGINSKTD